MNNDHYCEHRWIVIHDRLQSSKCHNFFKYPMNDQWPLLINYWLLGGPGAGNICSARGGNIIKGLKPSIGPGHGGLFAQMIHGIFINNDGQTIHWIMGLNNHPLDFHQFSSWEFSSIVTIILMRSWNHAKSGRGWVELIDSWYGSLLNQGYPKSSKMATIWIGKAWVLGYIPLF